MENRLTVKIDGDIADLLIEEQARLRKLEGKRATYSDVLRRMWEAYKPITKHAHEPKPETPETRVLKCLRTFGKKHPDLVDNVAGMFGMDPSDLKTLIR